MHERARKSRKTIEQLIIIVVVVVVVVVVSCSGLLFVFAARRFDLVHDLDAQRGAKYQAKLLHFAKCDPQDT